MIEAIEMSEAAKRHAIAMSAASFQHGCMNPGDANPAFATAGAAMQLGVMVSQLVDMGIVAPDGVGVFMRSMVALAEEVAASSIGRFPS